jgi:CheY-like chemotaxis protein
VHVFAPPAACGPLAKYCDVQSVVLVVDDKNDAAELIAEYLVHRGALALCAGSAASALEVLRGVVVDAVVTDYAMPGGDGIALCRAARERGREIPFVMISGHDVAGDVAQLARAEGIPFLPKPVSLEQLTSVLAQIVHRAPEEQRAAESRRAG